MTKKYGRTLVALIFLLGLAVSAKAQIRREIVVTLPFEFVVNGKTLPAGTYTVSRLSDDKFAGLILSSYENGASVIVYPRDIESAPADKAKVSFERVGDQRFLIRIQTANDVYDIPVPRSAILAAAAQSVHSGVDSGSSGGN